MLQEFTVTWRKVQINSLPLFNQNFPKPTNHIPGLSETTFIFTARCYASAVLAMALCPSVCLSVTNRSSTKTAKRRITQTTPHDSPGTLVF